MTLSEIWDSIFQMCSPGPNLHTSLHSIRMKTLRNWKKNGTWTRVWFLSLLWSPCYMLIWAFKLIVVVNRSSHVEHPLTSRFLPTLGYILEWSQDDGAQARSHRRMGGGMGKGGWCSVGESNWASWVSETYGEMGLSRWTGFKHPGMGGLFESTNERPGLDSSGQWREGN